MTILLLRVLIFSLWVILVGSVVACFTMRSHDIPVIDEAYEREVKALRLTTFGEPEDERLPIERRAQHVAKWVSEKIDQIKLPGGGGRVGRTVEAGVSAFDPKDWYATVFKPRLKRFLPVFYLRVETYLVAYATLLPAFIICFFWGTYNARLKMRQGVHKRNWPVRVFMWFLRSLNVFAVGATGFVLAPPVVYWMLPSFLIGCIVMVLWRSYHIEMM